MNAMIVVIAALVVIAAEINVVVIAVKNWLNKIYQELLFHEFNINSGWVNNYLIIKYFI